MRIYTKTGDDGTTSLCDGKRVSKNSMRVAAYGDIDELSSCIGLAVSFSEEKKLTTILHTIQHDLFILGSYAAHCSNNHEKLPDFDEAKIYALESIIDEISESLPPLQHFILPGGTPCASHLHMARTVCRRAERTCIALAENEGLYKHIIPYLNRLSDLLFVLARKANKGNDVRA
ncbi:cob(I)yrinic acid a,c-diamide adenosyltransferase [Candidatus Peregrinibacteria bacterium]|nr:cob(I)yrinic acid a,c-diamide adenosyltransferase [Candidatus Peregrinibacteria bacterium]